MRKLILMLLISMVVFVGCADKKPAPVKKEKFSDQYLVYVESVQDQQMLVDIKRIIDIVIDGKADRCTVFQTHNMQFIVIRCGEFLKIIKDKIGFR